MWNLPRVAASLFSGFDTNESNAPQFFEQEYACYPVSFAGRDRLEHGNKILLPQSALNILARMNVTWPMLFKISNKTYNRETHGGVLEFSAEEGTCYLPYWIMKNLLLNEGDIVCIENTFLPKGTYVKLQPITKDFLEISDHRAVLEYTLRHFAALTVGDNILIQHNNKAYEIEIIECLPEQAVSIIETDVQVDFAQPKDYIEPPNPSLSNVDSSKTIKSSRSCNENISISASQNQLGNNESSQLAMPMKIIPGGVRTVCPEEQFFHSKSIRKLTNIRCKSLDSKQFKPFEGESRPTH